MNILLRAVIWISTIVSVLSLISFAMYIRPARFTTNLTPADIGLAYENVRFTAQDGVRLAGWFVPAKTQSDRIIILCHGYPADKNNILGSTYFLAGKFNLFYFDFRYLGESEGAFSSVGYHERKDLTAAIQWVSDRGFSKIGIYGFSLGGAVSIMAQPQGVSAIVSDSAFASIDRLLPDIYSIFPWFTKYPFVWMTKLYTRLFLGIRTKDITPSDTIGNLNIPILLIHSKQDSQIPFEHALQLYEASDKNKTILWTIEGADHGLANFQNRSAYEKRVTDFFDQHIK